MQIKTNATNINERFLVVKKTRSGFLYYNRYRKTGDKHTYYAHLFTQEEAQKKLEWLKANTKGSFEIIPAKHVFCNTWNFTLSNDYNTGLPYITVSNGHLAVEQAKGGYKFKNFDKAFTELKKACEDAILYNKKDIESKQKQIAQLQTAISNLQVKSNDLTHDAQSHLLEHQLKTITEQLAVPADFVVSILFNKADQNG